jgi:hypothetical protein
MLQGGMAYFLAGLQISNPEIGFPLRGMGTHERGMYFLETILMEAFES